MQISQLTIGDLKSYSNCFHDMDDTLFTGILAGAKAFISSYTGKPLVDLDEHEDLTIALLIVANEMYDNRQIQVESDKIGFVIRQLLDAHSVNLI